MGCRGEAIRSLVVSLSLKPRTITKAWAMFGLQYVFLGTRRQVLSESFKASVRVFGDKSFLGDK